MTMLKRAMVERDVRVCDIQRIVNRCETTTRKMIKNPDMMSLADARAIHLELFPDMSFDDLFGDVGGIKKKTPSQQS